MKNILIILFIFLVTGCSAINNKNVDIKPKGELLAYFQITNPTQYKKGYYFYKENRKDQNPTLYVYE